jgi:sugar phosphate isomerase/epimerase
MDRRTFLAGVPAAVFAADRGRVGRRVGGTHLEVDGRHSRIDGFGVQLYTLRREMATDVDGTLATVAEIGYTEVEFAGLHGLTAREMRAKLDAVGLRAASSHHGVDLVRDGWERTLEDAQALGQRLIVVPGLPGDERTRDGISRIADDFNRAGEMASSAGLSFGYHNHDWEFTALDDGTIPMEHLLDSTDPEHVDWQMDVFWVVQGGSDPFEQLSRRAGRIHSIHVKDRTAAGDMVDVGDGVIDFVRFIPEAERQGLLHAFVEHDQPGDAVDSVRRSLRYLSGLDGGVA